jgi:hypothetical protein
MISKNLCYPAVADMRAADCAGLALLFFGYHKCAKHMFGENRMKLFCRYLDLLFYAAIFEEACPIIELRA